jgi:hypothetical protein
MRDERVRRPTRVVELERQLRDRAADRGVDPGPDVLAARRGSECVEPARGLALDRADLAAAAVSDVARPANTTATTCGPGWPGTVAHHTTSTRSADSRSRCPCGAGA